MDLRYTRGIQKDKKWIKYVEFEEALRGADYVTIHVPLLREGETDKPTYHLINEQTLKLMKPTAYLINASRGPGSRRGCTRQSAERKIHRRSRARRLRERTSAAGFAAARSGNRGSLPRVPPLASAGQITRLSLDPEKGMAGRSVQGLIDVLEGNYGGDPTKCRTW